MPALLKFLLLLASFHSGSYAHAFTSLSPVVGNQVRVNHLIRFQQPMSNPTNESSREPIREPINDRKKSEPIISYPQIKRDKSTPTFQLVVAFVSNNNALSFNDKPSSKFQLVVASVTNEFSKGLSKKTTQSTMNNSWQSRSFIDDVSIDSWQCPMKIDEVNFQRVGKTASTQSRGLCHDKTLHSSETIEAHSTLSETIEPRSTSSETIEPRSTSSETIEPHSKPIFTSEKTNGCQQLTHSANSEGGRLASLLLSGHKSVGIQPTSLKTAQRAIGSKCKGFQDNVLIILWQCRMEIDKVKSMKTAQRAISSKCKSFQSRGHCYDKKSERVGNSASTQLVGSYHDEKSEQAGCIASIWKD